MRIALVTTTINIPRVLELYARLRPAVEMFVVGDRKTPDEAYEFVENLGGRAFAPKDQAEWKCSELIGWNCIQRRNIGFLEALRWGANIVISIDDDNGAMDQNYVSDFERVFAEPFAGLRVQGTGGVWVDVGSLLYPRAKHRGIPYEYAGDPRRVAVSHASDEQVVVAAGVCLGDPDIDAATRMEATPIVHQVSELLRSGFVVKSYLSFSSATVWNSQNTAIWAEYLPAWFMFPHLGRYDDIFASLVCQRVMREHRTCVHFGRPFVWQQRNQHDLRKDLAAEMLGMSVIDDFVWQLDQISLVGHTTVLEQARHIYTVLRDEAPRLGLPPQAFEAALAYCDDIVGIVK